MILSSISSRVIVFGGAMNRPPLLKPASEPHLISTFFWEGARKVAEVGAGGPYMASLIGAWRM